MSSAHVLNDQDFATGRDSPAARPTLVALPAERSAMIDAHLRAVDALLVRTVSELTGVWAELVDDGAPDILQDFDLPQVIGQSINGGKRFRAVMSYLGWLASGGAARNRGRRDVVRVGAALEMLQLFVLVHDDVMDESASRRGRPTVHVRATGLHTASNGMGSAQRFGESIAVLVGDLAHAEAGNLVAALPPAMRRIWRVLVAELVAGQRRDLVGSATGRRDLDFARSVARSKSGRYTVQRPLNSAQPERTLPPPPAWTPTVGPSARRSPCATTCWGSGATRRSPGNPLVTT
jgi:geranylgeranyl diphosphate synthase type I